MPVTIRDVESSILYGLAEYQQWRSGWEAQFYKPVAQRMVRLMLQQMTPEQKRMLEGLNGEEYQKALEFSGTGG
jgi:hypothetical protein